MNNSERSECESDKGTQHNNSKQHKKMHKQGRRQLVEKIDTPEGPLQKDIERSTSESKHSQHLEDTRKQTTWRKKHIRWSSQGDIKLHSNVISELGRIHTAIEVKLAYTHTVLQTPISWVKQDNIMPASVSFSPAVSAHCQ